MNVKKFDDVTCNKMSNSGLSNNFTMKNEIKMK